jgi:hypothetical protein
VLDLAIGPIPPTREHPVERPWGAYQRQLKQQLRKTMRLVSFDALHFCLPSQSSGGEEEEEQAPELMEDDDSEVDDDDIESTGQDAKKNLKKIFSECFGDEINKEAQKKIRRAFSGKRVLRNRKEAIDYNEAKHESDKPQRRDWRTAEEHPVTNELMMAKKEGYRGLKILSSTIEGAGWGLFATQKYGERDILCTYEGATLPKNFTEDKAVAGRDYIAMGRKPIGKTGRFETVFIDA